MKDEQILVMAEELSSRPQKQQFSNLQNLSISIDKLNIPLLCGKALADALQCNMASLQTLTLHGSDHGW